MRRSLVAALLVALSSACGRDPDPVVHAISNVPPQAPVRFTWIENGAGGWHWWVLDVENPQPVDVATIAAGRIDQISLADDGRHAIAMTSEHSSPTVFDEQRVWVIDIERRQMFEMPPPVTYVYEVGVDGETPWLVGSTFRGDYGAVRGLLAKLLPGDPGCHPATARTYVWRGAAWELHGEATAADCAMTTGPVGTLALELPSEHTRIPPWPSLVVAALGRWELFNGVGSRLVLRDQFARREVLRRENVAAATFWMPMTVVDPETVP